MLHLLQRAIATLLVALACAACGGGGATPAPPMTFDAYGTAFCGAWDALFTAVGNPDTGSGSVLSKSLDDAVTARDAASADRIAATITTKLELARQQAAVAARWPSAATMLGHFDRVVVAYEAMIAAKREAAKSAEANPQAAFEQAGGLEAWTAMFETYRTVARPSGASTAQCPTVPIAP